MQTASVQGRLLSYSLNVKRILISTKLDYLKRTPTCRQEVRKEQNTSVWVLKLTGSPLTVFSCCMLLWNVFGEASNYPVSRRPHFALWSPVSQQPSGGERGNVKVDLLTRRHATPVIIHNHEHKTAHVLKAYTEALKPMQAIMHALWWPPAFMFQEERVRRH